MTSQPANSRQENPMVAFNNQLATRADQFRMVLPRHISPDQFQRTILTAVQTDPSLLEADRQSLLLACMKCAQDGLLPDKREAAFVIYTNRVQRNGQWESVKVVQYMPMVYGLRKKILQSGKIKDITAKVVYRCEHESGAFIYEEGTEAALRHRPMLEMTAEQAADDQIIAFYSMVTFDDGSKSYEVMRRFEVDKVRQASQTGALGKTVMFGADRGKPIEPKGPWVDWYPEQGKKTVMRRHSKTLPMSGDLIDIEARDDEMSARSTEAVLAAPQDAPALSAVPTRAALTAGDDSLTITNTIDATVNHDADGVVLDEKPKFEARAKKADKAKAEPQRAAEESTATAEDGAQTIYDRLMGRINNAATVGSLNKAVYDIPDTLPETWQSSLREQAMERDGELRGGK